MHELIDRLERIRDGRFGQIDFGSGWNRVHFRIGGGDDMAQSQLEEGDIRRPYAALTSEAHNLKAHQSLNVSLSGYGLHSD